jgi:hypothetical protein
MNKLPEDFGHSGFTALSQGAQQRRRGRPVENIPGSARYEHDKKRENTGGNPSSGHKKPELPRLVVFTPRSI